MKLSQHFTSTEYVRGWLQKQKQPKKHTNQHREELEELRYSRYANNNNIFRGVQVIKTTGKEKGFKPTYFNLNNFTG